MKTIRKIMQIIIYTVLTLLVLFALYTFICERILKKDYVNVFGYTYFVVSTGSMEPELSVNDIIVVKLHDKYKVNDIITYKESNSYITHRIISIDGKKITPKGDANNAADDNINKSQIIGKVIKHFPLGSILKLIGGILILFVLVSIINFEKIFKKYAIKEDNPELDNIINTIIADKEKIEVLSMNPTSATASSDIYAFLKDVTSILDIDREALDIYNNETIKKLEYIYRLTLFFKQKNAEEIKKIIENPNFSLKIDYDLKKIDFTPNIHEKLDTMPAYVYLKIMLISILYGKDDFHDVVYKVMKNHIEIDAQNNFITNNDEDELEEVAWALETIETINTKVKLNLSKEKKYIEAKEELNEN